MPLKTPTGKPITPDYHIPTSSILTFTFDTCRKVQKQKKVTALEGEDGGASASASAGAGAGAGASSAAEKPQLSRREREELERQRAKAHYQKLHAEGKTEEARADLAR